MAIATAKQTDSNRVEVYNDSGNFMFSISGELMGFTSSTVSVKNGSRIEVYGDDGNFKFSK
ncbi:MAG: hypothetical protein FWC26_06525 [Fibromonadales bacterium]|nr:hypothetical protein [Fibromonadales bacterium]